MTFAVCQGDPSVTSTDVSRSKRVNRDNLIQIKNRTIVYLGVLKSHKVQITLVSIANIYSCFLQNTTREYMLESVCELN